ncbi:DUF5693 family protein, partial [Candidatus Margulisiibacteriota bacterium]
MLFENKYFKYTLLVLFIISILVSFRTIFTRYQFERKNKNVDIVISLQEINRLALLGGIEKSELIAQLMNKGNITSIALEEETLESLISSGRVTLLRGSEIQNMLRVGKVYNYFLTHLKNKVVEDYYYLVVDETSLFERISDFLKAELGAKNVTEMGWHILEVADELTDLKEIGLGVSREIADQMHAFGLSVIPRIKNSTRLNNSLINLKSINLSKLKNSDLLVFEGDTVLGYPNKISLVADKMQSLELQFGYIEFAKQYGAKTLARSMPKKIRRVHSISEQEMEIIAKSKAIDRYIRATKERGVRVLFIHPFFNYFSDNKNQNIIEYNIDYYNQITTQLKKIGFTITATPELAIENYVPITKIEIFLISIGIFVALLLLINYFIPLTAFFSIIYSFSFLLAFYIFNVTGHITSWNTLFSLLAAVTFPSIAIISQFPEKTIDDKHTRIWKAFLYTGKLALISLSGALLIIALLSDPKYILGINLFFGVKISFLLPLALISFYFFLRPQRIKSSIYVIKRLLSAPIRTGY